MNRRSVVLIAVCVVVLGGGAYGEEKDFFLKTGRKIRGELVEETAGAYVVKVGGGTVRLARDSVARVESVVPATEGPFAPAAPAPAPDQTKTAQAPQAGGAGPLATPEAVAAGKKVLRDLSYARESTRPDLKDLEASAAALPLETVMAILADPDGLTRDATAIAADRVASASAATIRSLAARAIAGSNKQPSAELCSAISGAGDDLDGTVERAIDNRIESGPEAPPPPLLRLLQGKIGTTRSVPALGKSLSVAGADAIDALAMACTAIITRADDPDHALQPVKALVAAASPRSPGSEALLSLFLFYKRGADIEDLVIGAVNRAEGDTATSPAEKGHVNDFLARGYHLLLAIRTDAAVDRVFRAARMAQPLEWRITAVRTLGDLASTPAALRHQGEGEGMGTGVASGTPDSDKKPDPALLTRIVGLLGDDGRTQDERDSIVAVLQGLTHQTLGDDEQAWKVYIFNLH